MKQFPQHHADYDWTPIEMIDKTERPTEIPPTVSDPTSPSITFGTSSGPAYEIKFLLSEAGAQRVQGWATTHLTPDCHGEASLGGAYRTSSLYTDTPEFDVYLRSPGYRRRKYRIRRYGLRSEVFVERKTRRGDRVAKRRDILPMSDLPQLTSPLSLISDLSGNWFHQQLVRKRLLPICQVEYERTAFYGSSNEGPVRLTLDRNVSGAPAHDWSWETSAESRLLLTGMVILELKFRTAMPALFKQLVQAETLMPSGVSKFRRCLEAWQLPSAATVWQVKYA